MFDTGKLLHDGKGILTPFAAFEDRTTRVLGAIVHIRGTMQIVPKQYVA